jgi:carboxypeptidase PM20D1
MIKRILFVLLAVLILLIAILLINTFQFESKQLAIKTLPAPPLPQEAVVHLQEAIKHKTISYDDPALFDSTRFLDFRKFLETTYPNVHTKLQREIIKDYSLLYTWPGADPSLKPVILMAHQDVVPIEESSRGNWSMDPFAGEVKDGFIWGRGSTDNKINLISILETVEKLLKENYQPRRTIYLVFGHDEEIGGTGAKAIATQLKQQGITAEMVLDEGGIITLDKVPKMTKPVALIGTAEKGYLSLELSVDKNGGHSSMPETETALDILMKAILRLRENPFEADFSQSTIGFLNHVGPEMPFVEKIVFANSWLFKGVVIGIYEKSAGGNALVRTTVVPTIFHAGVKDNVVPSRVTATVNLRLLPGDNSEKILNEIKGIINDDRVAINPMMAFLSEPTVSSPEDGFGYQLIDETIKKTFDQTITTPFLMIGGTDSRHFGDVSTNIIKFSPMTDPIGFHGIDERISLDSYQHALWFYEQLLRHVEIKK